MKHFIFLGIKLGINLFINIALKPIKPSFENCLEKRKLPESTGEIIIYYVVLILLYRFSCITTLGEKQSKTEN